DSKVVYSLAEVLRERRDGYGWYTYEPEQVLDRYAAWRLKQSGHPITVAADGSGDYRTAQAAFDACPPHSTIYIKGGVYREKLLLTKDSITLLGDDNTILTFDDHPGKLAANGDSINTRNSYSFRVTGNNFTARNITFRNDAGFTAGQAVGVEARGDREAFID